MTAIKHFTREKGIAAELIRTNNTQNKLSVPDFRSNDPIQIWLEQKFKDTKPKGSFLQIEYGRKRPYPRNSSSKIVIKLQDLGKIRYAWLYDPRVSIAEPSKIFELKSDGGYYEDAFGVGGESVNSWSEDQFSEALLAVYTYGKLNASLEITQKANPEIKQLSRLKYYALKLFYLYIQRKIHSENTDFLIDIGKFGAKYEEFYIKAEKIIIKALKNAYTELTSTEDGQAFWLPRDAKVWQLIQRKFQEYLDILDDEKI